MRKTPETSIMIHSWMQHDEHTQTVLTIYTALCNLQKTTYAGLIEKQHNDYTSVQSYTPRHSIRKFYKQNSTMTLNENSVMITHTGAHLS